MDNLTPQERSRQMSLIRSKDTKPELFVRRLVHALGYRYRLHRAELPGRPDLVFTSRRKVIFIHGCFWHGHTCRLGRMPKSRLFYWEAKIGRNKERDKRTLRHLHAMGWECLVLWECRLRKVADLEKNIIQFLGRRSAQSSGCL
ncbi:MAG: very short patch repair endonuclease [Acidobacteriaceae bacterium]